MLADMNINLINQMIVINMYCNATFSLSLRRFIMNTKAHKRRQLAEKQTRFSRKYRGNKLTQGRRNFVGSTVPNASLRREKAYLVIAAMMTGSLWVASLWVITSRLPLPG